MIFRVIFEKGVMRTFFSVKSFGDGKFWNRDNWGMLQFSTPFLQRYMMAKVNISKSLLLLCILLLCLGWI